MKKTGGTVLPMTRTAEGVSSMRRDLLGLTVLLPGGLSEERVFDRGESEIAEVMTFSFRFRRRAPAQQAVEPRPKAVHSRCEFPVLCIGNVFGVLWVRKEPGQRGVAFSASSRHRVAAVSSPI